MTPVGATNVGSIKINFDAELRTNSVLSDKAADRAAALAAKRGEDVGRKNIEDRILCIVPGLGSFRDSENRLIYSDNYFKGGKSQEVPLNNGRAVSGVVSTVAVTKYILAAAKSARTNELALYVSDDATRWHRAVFYGHKLVEKSYTVLDSTDYSIQVSVSSSLNQFNPMGNIFTSNSNGTYFTRNVEHVNSNELGYVDFEKVSGIQGIMLVNTVENWADVEAGMGGEKKIVSQISYDDGRTFEPVKVKGTSKRLHLHSVTQMSNIGKVFSSPAPGLIMGIGNTGDYLKEYSDGDLYVSDDGGRTWWKALSEAH
ncbi:vacuolar protein sorting/targeting protein PEP1, partial [Ascosphaera atra]